MQAGAQGTLTLQEAQRRAVERSRQLAAQDAAVLASREMAVAAAQLPDPVATLGIDNVPVDGPDAFSVTRDFMTMRRVGLMQEFTRLDKRNARAARFQREADQAAAEKAVMMAAIQRDTALAWLDRHYAEAMAALLAEQLREARAEIDAAEGAYRAGKGTLSDVLMAKSALVALDDRDSELARRVTTARIMLARWVGDGADAPLTGSVNIDSIRLNLRTLDSDLEHHPAVAALATREALAAADVGVAQANRHADWSIGLMYSLRGAPYSNMVSVNVSVPLQWDRPHRQDREVAAKLALREQVHAERDDELRATVAEVRAMIAEWEGSRVRRDRIRDELAPLAADRALATSAAYRGGKSSLTEVLLARRNEIDVRMQVLQLEAEAARLWARLNFLLPDGGSALDASTVELPR
jgi:outer membrane protein TolC